MTDDWWLMTDDWQLMTDNWQLTIHIIGKILVPVLEVPGHSVPGVYNGEHHPGGREEVPELDRPDRRLSVGELLLSQHPSILPPAQSWREQWEFIQWLKVINSCTNIPIVIQTLVSLDPLSWDKEVDFSGFLLRAWMEVVVDIGWGLNINFPWFRYFFSSCSAFVSIVLYK